jgi:chromate transporter
MSLAIPVLLAAKAACEPVKLSDWHNLLAVIWDFLTLSLFSLGGGNTLLAEYHSIAVH